ncbi:MAG: hypothetical protein ACRBCJ_08790 [Hyphomicrobiaceae bacterium]
MLGQIDVLPEPLIYGRAVVLIGGDDALNTHHFTIERPIEEIVASIAHGIT